MAVRLTKVEASNGKTITMAYGNYSERFSDPDKVTNMSWKEWTDGTIYSWSCLELLDRLEGDIEARLKTAVALWLHEQSKDVHDDQGGILQAAALLLLEEPINPKLLAIGHLGRAGSEPLYERTDLREGPRLDKVWSYHHRKEIADNVRKLRA